jgi:hypothetical protein
VLFQPDETAQRKKTDEPTPDDRPDSPARGEESFVAAADEQVRSECEESSLHSGGQSLMSEHSSLASTMVKMLQALYVPYSDTKYKFLLTGGGGGGRAAESREGRESR